MSLSIYFGGCIPPDSCTLQCYWGCPDHKHRQEGLKSDRSQMWMPSHQWHNTYIKCKLLVWGCVFPFHWFQEVVRESYLLLFSGQASLRWDKDVCWYINHLFPIDQVVVQSAVLQFRYCWVGNIQYITHYNQGLVQVPVMFDNCRWLCICADIFWCLDIIHVELTKFANNWLTKGKWWARENVWKIDQVESKVKERT